MSWIIILSLMRIMVYISFLFSLIFFEEKRISCKTQLNC